MTTLPHTSVRNRTIPSRLAHRLRSFNIWRILAWLRLDDVYWSRWWPFAVVVVSLMLALDGRGYWGLWVLGAAMVMRK